MLKKILLIVANIILVLLPFSPVLSGFAPFTGSHSFTEYLIAWAVLSIVLVLLAYFVASDKLLLDSDKSKLTIAAWALFALSILVSAPLHMGPPEQSIKLLEVSGQEQFRYSLLLIAVAVFAIGSANIIAVFWPGMKVINKTIAALLAICFFISFWDYFDSLMFGSYLKDWMASGKDGNAFFPTYDYHENCRAVGRILLYVIAIWLSILLVKKAIIKRWIAISLGLFSFAGIGFCLAFLIHGPAFYFPFMVPAIAMAPAYWLGIALLNVCGSGNKSRAF